MNVNKILDRQPAPWEQAAHSELLEDLERVAEQLPEIYRAVLRCRFGIPRVPFSITYTIQETADILGLCRSRVLSTDTLLPKRMKPIAQKLAGHLT